MTRRTSPGYFANAPLYPAIKALRDSLGYQDSYIQASEIAIRFLRERLVTEKSDGLTISQLARKYSIPETVPDSMESAQILARAYLVQTHAVAEQNWSRLIGEILAYKNIPPESWQRSRGGENIDAFGQLIANLAPTERKVISNCPELEIFEYYRLIRNWTVHGGISSRKKADAIWQKLDKQYFHDSYALNAPNDSDKMKFSDFCLYTRAIKYFGNAVNDAWCLSMEELAGAMLRDPTSARKIARSKGAGEKMHYWTRKIAGRYYTMYHGGNPQLKERFESYCEANLVEER